ncbi:MAG: Mrp/NBP35 family ATP-binding protein [Pseudomonadota bacterium]
MADMSADSSENDQVVRTAVETIAGERARNIRFKHGVVMLVLDVSGMEQLQRDKMDIALRDTLRQIDGVKDVRIAMTSEKVTRRIIAIGSGKGGVGKSTVSANIAIAMHRLGRKVGMVDADIYGPSQTRLLDCADSKPEVSDQKLVPMMTGAGIPLLSMGQLAKPGQAIAWRGPMAGKALAQLIDAHWGETSDLVVDLPPGTGDVQMSLMQQFKPDGAIIVSTPQDLALLDATRAINLFDQGNIPVVGMIENMAGYLCPHCGEISDPFGSGGAEAAAKTMELPFLGRVPLDMVIRKTSDAGTPIAGGDSPQAQSFIAIAQKLIDWLEAQKPGAVSAKQPSGSPFAQLRGQG